MSSDPELSPTGRQNLRAYDQIIGHAADTASGEKRYDPAPSGEEFRLYIRQGLADIPVDSVVSIDAVVPDLPMSGPLNIQGDGSVRKAEA